MREIKFRAWDRKNKKLCRVTKLDFPEWYVAVKDSNNYYEGERNSFKNEETDRHILMQYIGLNLHPNIELYDGDILAVTLNSDTVIKAAIEYYKGAYYVRDYKVSNVLHKAKLIGNIHENKELLDDE